MSSIIHIWNCYQKLFQVFISFCCHHHKLFKIHIGKSCLFVLITSFAINRVLNKIDPVTPTNIPPPPQRMNIFSDDIFLHTKWPWILHTESSFLNVWEVIVVITVAIIAVGHPFEIVYTRKFSDEYFSIYRLFGQIIYLLDIVFKLVTAVETDQGKYVVHRELLMSLLRVRLSWLKNYWILFKCMCLLVLFHCSCQFRWEHFPANTHGSRTGRRV